MPFNNIVPIENWVRLKEIGGTVRDIINVTDYQRLQRCNVFSECFPTKFVDGTDYEGLRADYQTPIANLVNLDQTAPPVRAGKLTNFQVNFIKMVSRRVFTEAEQQKLYKATNEYGLNLGITTYPRKSFDGKNLPPTKTAKGNLEIGWVHPGHNIADFFFTVGITHRRHAVFDMMDFLTAQCIQFGEATYVDQATNYRVDLNWKDADADYDNFPDPLVQTGDTLDKSKNTWDDTRYADGLRYIRDEHQKFIDRNGHSAKHTLLTRKTYYKLLDLESTKLALRPYIARGAQLSLVPSSEFNKYLENYDIPPMRIVDDKFDYIKEDGSIGQAKFFNDGRISFISPKMGSRYWGVVMNSKPGLQGPPKPGIYSDIIKQSEESAARIAFAEGQGAPVVHNIKLLHSCQVFVA